MSGCELTVYVGVCVCVCVFEVGARLREHRLSGSGLWTGYRRNLWISVKQNITKS